MLNLDPGLNTDKTVFMRADFTDTGPLSNGARNVPPVWWLSPDIELTGATSGQDKADPGVQNTVNVRFTVNGTMPPDVRNRVRVALWVGDPQMVMTPTSNTTAIGSELLANPLQGQNTHQFLWTPGSTDPESPGHKCLVARCYPHANGSLTGNSQAFHLPDDPHYAQRNICIVPCASPCGQTVLTTNVFKKTELVRILAVADLEPNEHVRTVMLRALGRFPGFKRLATKPPPAFDLLFPDVRNVKIVNRSDKPSDAGRYGRLAMPNVEAKLELKPQQTIAVKFLTDLDRVPVGSAYLYHMMHIGSDKQVQGGLTLAVVKVKA